MTELASLLDTLGISSSNLTPFIRYDTGLSFLLTIDGANALPTWYSLRQVSAKSGFLPVLLGDHDSYREHEYLLKEFLLDEDHIPVTASIAAALVADPLAWFRSQAQRLDRLYRTSYAIQEPPFVVEPPRSGLASSPPIWRLKSDPYIPEPNTFGITTELIYPQAEDINPILRIQPAPTIYLALFPTQTAWHIPAYLPSRVGNDRLSVEDQLVVWRWWNSRYQAEIVGGTCVSIEAWVTLPPADLQHSQRLAWEQQVYCPDVITLVTELPTDLIDAFVWSFWWD
jgi:hypothetical protein